MGREQARMKNSRVDWFNLTCDLLPILGYNFISFLAALDRPSTKTRQMKSGSVVDPTCVFCYLDDEARNCFSLVLL